MTSRRYLILGLPVTLMVLIGCAAMKPERVAARNLAMQQQLEREREGEAEILARFEKFCMVNPAVYFAFSNHPYTIQFMDVDGVERSRTYLAGAPTFFAANPELHLRIFLKIESNHTTPGTIVRVGIVRNGKMVAKDFKEGYDMTYASALSN